MATINTNGTAKALMVIDAATKAPIDIPLKAQEAILTPIVNLREWIKQIMRTGGIGQRLPGGKIKYYAYPKQTDTRDLTFAYDDTTGKLSGGLFGAADANDMIDGRVKSTYGTKLVSDEIGLEPAWYLSHLFMKQDLKEQGLESQIAWKLQDFYAETAEKMLVSLKAGLVAAVGTVGKWATDAGFTLPTFTAGQIGSRVLGKDYTVDAAGGEAAVTDIIATLEYRDKVGLKDGVEATYPFARGLNSASSAKIFVSGNVNKAILKAVEKSTNGFLAGVGVNTALGLVTSISYEGKTVAVEVVTDMPAKSAKAFNWLIIEIGKYGALAIETLWANQNAISDEGLLAKRLEAIAIQAGLKFLQPELMYASFAA